MNKKVLFPLIGAMLLAGCNSNNNSNSNSNSNSSSNSTSASVDAKLNELLELLSGDLKLEGNYVKNQVNHTITTIFLENSYACQEISEEESYLQKFIKTEDGIYKQSINKDNEVENKIVTKDSTAWSKYANPFKNLDANSFIKSTATTYLVKNNLVQNISAIVTGWDFVVRSMQLSVTDKVQLIINVDGKFNGDMTFTFDVTKATEDLNIKYATNAKSETLSIAVEDIYKNYVITDVKHVAGQDDETKVYYRTEDVFFSSYEDSETSNYGYAFKNDAIYSFKVENGLARDVVLFSDDTSTEINFRLDFDFSWDLFRYDATNDIYVTQDKTAVNLVASAFAYSYDSYVEFSNYATSIEVKLKGEALDYYVVHGFMNGVSYERKITVSNIGSATQPFDVTSIDNNKEDLSKINESYYGTYKGTLEVGTLAGITSDITLVISSNKVTLNGEEVTISKIKYYENKYIEAYFEWKGVELFFSEYIQSGDAGKSLQIANESFSIRSSELKKDASNSCADIAGTYKASGLYSYNDENSYDVTIVITNNAMTLNFDNGELANVSFTFVNKSDDDIYTFKDANDKTLEVSFYEKVLLIEYDVLGFHTDSGEFIKQNESPDTPDKPTNDLSSIVGTWKAETVYNYDTSKNIDWVQVVISEDGSLVLTSSDGSINGTFAFKKFESTVAHFANGEVELTFELYGTIGYVECTSLGLALDSGDFIKQTETPDKPDTPTVDLSSLAGTWKNSEATFNENYVDSYEVTVVINDNTLTINCPSKNEEVLNNQTFTFVSKDSDYYVFNNATYGDIKVELSGNDVMYVIYEKAGLNGGDSGEFIKQTKTPDTPDTPTNDLSSIVGTWKAETVYNYDTSKNIDWVQVVISEDGSLVLTSSDASINGTFTFTKFESTVAHFTNGEVELTFELYDNVGYVECATFGIHSDSGDFIKQN